MDLFIQAAPGLEPALEQELAEVGLEGRSEAGGVSLEADLQGLARLHLHLACASRILVGLGEFRATALGELERKAGALPWHRALTPGRRIDFRVTSRKSRLYHTGAVAERLARAAAAAIPGVEPAVGGDGDEGGGDDGADVQRFVVRIVRDRVSVRADASGAHLHRRGYRLATAKAPLRETAAAALLRIAGWDPDTPLVDPLCGSGTFVVEAALRACRRAPGENRGFAWEHWPGAPPALKDGLRAEALARIRPPPAPLEGSDRDAGAVDAARANAERAGVAGAVAFHRRSISDAEPPLGADRPGLLIANPPWGKRMGRTSALRNLHARLGQVARRAFPGWTLALVSPSAELVRQADRRAERIAAFGSGGTAVGLWRVEVL